MTERTLSIIKPDAVAAGQSGRILAHLEQEGFRIVALFDTDPAKVGQAVEGLKIQLEREK